MNPAMFRSPRQLVLGIAALAALLALALVLSGPERQPDRPGHQPESESRSRDTSDADERRAVRSLVESVEPPNAPDLLRVRTTSDACIPIEGASLWAEGLGIVARSDRDGVAVIERGAVSVLPDTIVVAHPQFVPSEESTGDWSREHLNQVVLTSGGSISVRVTDHHGQPLSEVLVRASPSQLSRVPIESEIDSVDPDTPSVDVFGFRPGHVGARRSVWSNSLGEATVTGVSTRRRSHLSFWREGYAVVSGEFWVPPGSHTDVVMAPIHVVWAEIEGDRPQVRFTKPNLGETCAATDVIRAQLLRTAPDSLLSVYHGDLPPGAIQVFTVLTESAGIVDIEVPARAWTRNLEPIRLSAGLPDGASNYGTIQIVCLDPSLEELNIPSHLISAQLVETRVSTRIGAADGLALSDISARRRMFPVTLGKPQRLPVGRYRLSSWHSSIEAALAANAEFLVATGDRSSEPVYVQLETDLRAVTLRFVDTFGAEQHVGLVSIEGGDFSSRRNFVGASPTFWLPPGEFTIRSRCFGCEPSVTRHVVGRDDEDGEIRIEVSPKAL